MHPDWLGSPQHFVAGAALACAVALVARRAGIDDWRLLALLAVGVTSTAEVVVEIAEYAFRIAHATAYYDTIADLAATLAGALLGSAVGIPLGARLQQR